MDSPMLMNDVPRFQTGSPAIKVSDQEVSVCEVVEEEAEMWGLAVQPLEVLHHIFIYVDVQDVARLSSTCSHLRNCIRHDDLLWKEQFLKLFDEPIETPRSWRDALKDLLALRIFLRSDDRTGKESRLEDVANTAIKLVTDSRNANPMLNQAFLAELMTTRSNKSCFLSRSSLFQRAGHPLDMPADTEELRQLSAKLHVYYGVNIELNEAELEAEGSRLIHPYARARVYDLRRYTTKNEWGPLMDDGSGKVDWEKIQAIVTVLSCGVPVLNNRFRRLVTPFWGQAFHGLAANSFDGKPFNSVMVEEDANELTAQDPYGITGTYVRIVNFLDYHDLFAYNFQPPILPPEQERPPISTKEAIRLIWMQLRVTKIEEPQEGDDPSMPRVHFTGDCKSLTNSWDPNANSTIKGYVRKTIHGDIRWTSFSVVYGEERWRGECVQIGGPDSARGTVGTWFDKNYDAHGPAGPTAFWKISNGFIRTSNPRAGSDILNYQHLNFDEEIEDDDDDEDDDSFTDDDDDDDDDDDEDGEEDEDEGDEVGEEDQDIGLLTTNGEESLSHTEVTIHVTNGIITAVETREV